MRLRRWPTFVPGGGVGPASTRRLQVSLPLVLVLVVVVVVVVVVVEVVVVVVAIVVLVSLECGMDLECLLDIGMDRIGSMRQWRM
jgi:hypothetical protein